MASRPDYDFMLQLRRDVLRDAQTRLINASLSTNLALTYPISRVLAHTVAPFQMKAHWAKPELNIAKDAVKLSANVQGGARYTIEGVNLTLEGQVNAKCRPTVVVNDDGYPVITLATPSPLDLHLGDLKVSYKGDDELLTRVDTAIEHTLLRPTLSAQLMAPLANLTLNYMPDAVPLRLTQQPGDFTAPTDGLTLADATVSLDPHTESLTLAMRYSAHTPAPNPRPNLLPEHTTANAALALSQTSLNEILRWLCTQGLATGTTRQADRLVSWRWAQLAAAFTGQTIHLAGQLWLGQTATVVDAEVQCFLTSATQLSVQQIAPKPHPINSDVVRDAWATLLRRYSLRLRAHQKRLAP